MLPGAETGPSFVPDLQTAVATVTAVRVTDHGAATVFQLPWGNKVLITGCCINLSILGSSGSIKVKMINVQFVY